MSDGEQIKLYAELLWWFLILLAAFSPIALVGILAMALRQPFPGPQPPLPPTFDEWLANKEKPGNYIDDSPVTR